MLKSIQNPPHLPPLQNSSGYSRSLNFHINRDVRIGLLNIKFLLILRILYVSATYFDLIYPLVLSNFSQVHPTSCLYSNLVPPNTFNNPANRIRITHMCQDVGPSSRAWLTLGATPLKKTGSSQEPLMFHARMLRGVALSRPCAGNSRHPELLSAPTLSCLEDTASLGSSPPSGSLHLSTPSFKWSWALWWGRVM